MDFNEIAVYVKVVQSGSFSQAARELSMPVSTVSSKVASLERRLGVTLLQRTTRKLNVTPAGRAYFNRCSQGIEEIKSAEGEVATSQSEPQGILKVTAPVDLGGHLLPTIVLEFAKKYPKVSLELILTDRPVDLVAEGVDLAIRMGDLKDSSLIAKKLGVIYLGIFASPAYLKLAAKIAAPKDLRSHQCLLFTPLRGEELRLTSAKGSATVAINGRLVVNDLHMLKGMAVAGGGPALLPSFLCYTEVKSGKLVHILPEWRANSRPVHFVYPEQRFAPPALKAFVSFSAELIKDRLHEFEI